MCEKWGEMKKELENLGKELKKLFMDQKNSIFLQNSDDHKNKIKNKILEIKKLKEK
jgi:hypothetical protein